MNDYIEYEKIVPSKAVRIMMEPKNIEDRSAVSLIMNGYFTWNERMKMLELVERSTTDEELKIVLKKYINLQKKMWEKMIRNDKKEFLYVLQMNDDKGGGYRFFSMFEIALKTGSNAEGRFDIAIVKISDCCNTENECDEYNSVGIDMTDLECEYGRLRYNAKAELINIIQGDKYLITNEKNDFSLLYSYVDIFNPFERGDIVCRVEDREDIGIVITSQRIWQSRKMKHTNFSDDLIKVEFISKSTRIKNVSICPINLEFVDPKCNLPQYDFLKSISNLIRGNGEVDMMLRCYKELVV